MTFLYRLGEGLASGDLEVAACSMCLRYREEPSGAAVDGGGGERSQRYGRGLRSEGPQGLQLLPRVEWGLGGGEELLLWPGS